MSGVLILGAQGMLGSELVQQLADRRIDHVGYDHYAGDVLQIDRLDTIRRMQQPDLVINCAGVRNAGSLVNSLGPWNVSRVFSCKIWHISTDCVFDHTIHKNHRHMPNAEPQPQSEYGISKLTGEIVAPHVSNIRTSFIGYKHGLLRWFLDLPPNSVVDGWVNALWSGSTVKEVATKLVQHVEITNLRRVEHLSAAHPISKHDLLCEFTYRFNRSDIEVRRVEEPLINRAMSYTMELEHVSRALPNMPMPVSA